MCGEGRRGEGDRRLETSRQASYAALASALPIVSIVSTCVKEQEKGWGGGCFVFLTLKDHKTG